MQKNISLVLQTLSEFGPLITSTHLDALIEKLAQEDVQLTDSDFFSLTYQEQILFCKSIEIIHTFCRPMFNKILSSFIRPGELMLGLESKFAVESPEAFLERYFNIKPSGLDLEGDEKFLENN